MQALQVVGPSSIYEHAKRGLASALGSPKATGNAWRMVAVLADGEMNLTKSKFFKSIRDEIDDDSKVANFAVLISALASASNVENYQAFFSTGSGVECKEAHHFSFKASRVRVLELKKQRKKERVYFFPHTIRGVKVFIMLLALHKRDETTPTSVKNYCETQISKILNAPNDYLLLE